MHDLTDSPLRVDLRCHGSAGVVTLHGELDLAGAVLVRDVVTTLPPAAAVVVIDLRGLTFLDCSGLGAVLRLRRELRHRGARVVLLASGGPALRLFAAAGLISLVSIVPARGPAG